MSATTQTLQLHVGLDWGTSTLSISYSFVNSKGEDPTGGPPRIREFPYHSIRSTTRSHNPITDLYWETNTSKPISGFELQLAMDHGEIDPSRLLKYPKLIAHTPTTVGSQRLNSRLLKQAKDLGKSKEDVLKAMSDIFYDDYLPKILRQAPEGISDTMEIYIAIAVPAGWELAEHEAFCGHVRERAGDMNISCVLKVREPEAQLRHLMRECGRSRQNTYKSGEKLLVVDGGGGTTDLTLFEIVDPASENLRTVREPHSLSNGMQIVTENFRSDVMKRLEGFNLPDCIDFETVIRRATDWFDLRKQWIGQRNDDLSVGMDSTQTSQGPKVKGLKDDRGRRFQSERILYTTQELIHILDHAFNATLKEMRELSRGIKLDLIYLCGGAANNEHIWNRLTSEYAMDKVEGLRIERPPRCKNGVSCGSVLASIQSATNGRYDQAIVANEFQGILILQPYSDMPKTPLSTPLSRFKTKLSTGDVLDEVFVIKHFMIPQKTLMDKNIKAGKKNHQDSVLIQRGPLLDITFYENDFKAETLLEGVEVATTLVTAAKAFETSPDCDFTVVNPIFEEGNSGRPIEQRDIQGFSDSNGKPIRAAIVNELCWRLILPPAALQWEGDSQRFIRVNHRILLYRNGLGDAEYKAQIEWKSNSGSKTPWGYRKLRTHMRTFDAKAKKTKGKFTIGSFHPAGCDIYRYSVLDKNVSPPVSSSWEDSKSAQTSQLASISNEKSLHNQGSHKFENHSRLDSQDIHSGASGSESLTPAFMEIGSVEPSDRESSTEPSHRRPKEGDLVASSAQNSQNRASSSCVRESPKRRSTPLDTGSDKGCKRRRH